MAAGHFVFSCVVLFSQLDLLVDEMPGSGPWNMAVDEAVARGVERPALRIYRWSGPVVSFGYFERVAEIRELRPGPPLVRRWTGGGMVDHGRDWTYSLMVPAGEPLARVRPAESYRLIHEAVRDFLRQMGHPAELAASAECMGEGCFQRPVPADVLVDGVKVAGAAQRRTRSFLLHQGSVQLPHEDWEPLEWARFFCRQPQARVLAGIEREHAARLEAERYGSPQWLNAR